MAGFSHLMKEVREAKHLPPEKMLPLLTSILAETLQKLETDQQDLTKRLAALEERND